MELFDTHCHIQSAGAARGERATRELWAKAEDTSVDSLVASAQEAGVMQMLSVGCDVDDSILAIKCAQSRDNSTDQGELYAEAKDGKSLKNKSHPWPEAIKLYASIGIHPHEAQRYIDDKVALDRFAALATEEKVVAVGECGLDYFYTHSPKEAQIEILKFQLELAQKHDLPVIFHVREAFDDFWPIFESYKGVRGVLHSFTDSMENMHRALKHGLFIGVNGIATFTKNEDQLAMYRSIPVENLLLETDAPFLTPVPFRGKVCEPKHLVLTAAFLADLRGATATEIAEATTRNARKLFNV